MSLLAFSRCTAGKEERLSPVRKGVHTNENSPFTLYFSIAADSLKHSELSKLISKRTPSGVNDTRKGAL